MGESIANYLFGSNMLRGLEIMLPVIKYKLDRLGQLITDPPNTISTTLSKKEMEKQKKKKDT